MPFGVEDCIREHPNIETIPKDMCRTCHANYMHGCAAPKCGYLGKNPQPNATIESLMRGGN